MLDIVIRTKVTAILANEVMALLFVKMERAIEKTIATEPKFVKFSYIIVSMIIPDYGPH